MDDNKKKNAQDTNTNTKKSDRTEFADEINVDTKNNKSNSASNSNNCK